MHGLMVPDIHQVWLSVASGLVFGLLVSARFPHVTPRSVALFMFILYTTFPLLQQIESHVLNLPHSDELSVFLRWLIFILASAMSIHLLRILRWKLTVRKYEE